MIRRGETLAKRDGWRIAIDVAELAATLTGYRPRSRESATNEQESQRRFAIGGDHLRFRRSRSRRRVVASDPILMLAVDILPRCWLLCEGDDDRAQSQEQNRHYLKRSGRDQSPSTRECFGSQVFDLLDDQT